MYVIGIVGGVASGKSLATEYLRQLGAAVLDGDRAGHEVLREPQIIAAARRRWGEEILDAGGQVVRSKLAEIVFAPGKEAEQELRYLEELTHPRIRARLTDELARLETQGNCSVAVLDAPLLLKAGWDDFCDTILFIDTPQQLRIQRAAARGWTEQDVLRREAAQEPIREKRDLADVILDNGGPPEQLYQQIHDFWDSLSV